MIETGDKVTRKYSNFRGVDFRGEECGLNRSPDSLNMWRNYKKLASIETRPGLEHIYTSPNGVSSMMCHDGKLYFISNDGYLHALRRDGTIEHELQYVGSEAVLFEFDGKLYAKGTAHYCNITDGKEVIPYIPTTSIGRKPSGGGTIHEDVNMLSDYRKNTFLGDGKGTVFNLDAKDIDKDYRPVVEADVKDFPFNINLGDTEYVINTDYESMLGLQTVSGVEWTDGSTKKLVDKAEPGYVYFKATAIEEFSTDVDVNIQVPKASKIRISGLKYHRDNQHVLFIFGDTRVTAEKLFNDKSVEFTGVSDLTINVSDVHEYQNRIKIEIVDGADDFTVDYKNGKITFVGAPPSPLTDGQDNVTIQYKKANAKEKEKILRCLIVQEFDNRVFFSGNSDYPSTIWHSSLHDVSYFSDLDYYVDGVDQAPIRSMVAGNNGLWVFRDESASNNSVFYHTPALDDDYGKVYPSSHSSISLGCVGRAINFNDDIVFFSQRGMESASTDITTEQFVTHKSSLVDRKMITNPKYKDMILAEWEGYLLAFIGNEVYLADSRRVLSNENHIEYEWFYWNLGSNNVTCATVYDGVLYIGTEGNGVGHLYSLTREAKDGDAPLGYTPDGSKWEERMYIESYWTTPKDNFGAPNKLKTTNKKGCTTEALGDVEVSVKTNDDDAYELIGTNNGIDDYFVSRIKRKKFKDIQLKFESKTGFSLESATLEAFIGGYIKR